jgi:broad specificity phosphatase PhoE
MPNTTKRKQTVYFVRHAEAAHNILEKKAVKDAIARGVHEKEEQEKARRSVLNDVALKDAPLSLEGTNQAKRGSSDLKLLNKLGGSKYCKPSLILVSPLRRALMTATELFSQQEPLPKFIALEALREKRTGFFADERSHVDDLEKQFPHVDFSDLRIESPEIPKGEDNPAVRARGRTFLERDLAKITEESVALVTHKGWLRELRHTLRSFIDDGQLEVNFDIDAWDQTLYKNAEVRVAEFSWEKDVLRSIVSKSVENAMSSLIQEAVEHLIRRSMPLPAVAS